MTVESGLERPVLGTIAKSGLILDLFTHSRPEWGVSEVARFLGMPKSGAHSQLSALTQIGVLRRTAGSRYRLGWRLISLTHTLLESAGFRQQARRELERIVSRVSEQASAQLFVLDGDEVISVDQVRGSGAQASFVSSPGRRLPAHSTAAGKLLLAFADAPDPRGPVELQALTAATIVDPDQLERALAKVRVDGVAWDQAETLDGRSCVAAPVRDRDGAVIAAISVSGPSSLLGQAPAAFERLVTGASRRMGDQMRERFLGDRGKPAEAEAIPVTAPRAEPEVALLAS